MIKKYVKNTMIIIAFLVAVILISSSSMSITIRNISKPKKLYFTEVDEEISNGLAPPKEKIPVPSEIKSISTEQVSIGNDCPIMYGYKAYPTPEKIINFDTCDPGEIEEIAPTGSYDFIACATCTAYFWLGCENGSGKLWYIDIETGDMDLIGGGGVSLNGLAWDPVTNKLFGVSSHYPSKDKLWLIDEDTGEQTEIGEIDLQYTIGIAFDAEGYLYGWDLVQDSLHVIDPDTLEVETVGSLGIDLNYAQDGDFHRESDRLYLTAYTTTGQLYRCDKYTGDCELIGNFENDIQITGSIFYQPCPCVDHDVALKSINFPETGPAGPDMKMQVTVKNEGDNTETFDAQMQVDTYEEGPIILEEDFSGPFPPEGWTTDWWEQSNTNYACGEAPEAICDKNTQKNQGDYYDNYIMTKALDCSNIEAVKLSFKLTIDTSYPQYCYFHLKYRKDTNSPWKEITPWDNPIPWDFDCIPSSITIKGDPYLGEEFQVKWEYIGYYNYFNYIYIDNVTIQEYNCSDVYIEVVEDIVLGAGEEKIVDFPTWTPPNWQNPDYENTWQEFPIKACTFLSGDNNPGNNCKEKIIDLYFPWMHDIELTSIDSPCEDGPGQSYPVEATIKNVGQYAECCIPIDIGIGEPVVLDTLLDENAWDTIPPAGWYDEHKDFSESYGWNISYTSYSGGDSPEAILRYTQAKPDHVLYSYAIDTSGYSDCQFEFKSYINHYSGSGLYALEAGYSTDGETWYAAWHEEPGFDGDYDVKCQIEGGHETLYIGFWVKGNPYYFNYWYIDDISVRVLDFVTEYSDFACQGDDLEPGESRTFEFEDWTPDFLQYETSGSKDYIVHAEIDMEGDKNPDNDIKSEYFTLDYWHDCGINRVTSPADGKCRGDLLWDNGDTDGSNGYGILGSPKRTLLDDFEMEETWEVSELRTYMVAGPVNDWEVAIWSDDDGDPGELILGPSTDVDYSIEYTGRTWLGYAEYEVFYEFEPIRLDAGRYWVEMWSGSGAPNAFCMIHLGIWGSELWVNYDDLGFMPGSQQYGVQADMNFRLYGEAGCHCPNVYIRPGTEAIEAIAKNYGTFPEMDLTCYAEIHEYITDPENGTLVYEDNITNINLEEPLGGEENLEFEDYNFSMEGIYRLDLNMPTPYDDKYPSNNRIRLGVRVDDTPPISTHILDPPVPDGFNGWYISNIEVTLDATDPVSNGVKSGVDEIKYQVNGGPIQTITGCCGTFLLAQEDDGEDILVEYWAVDRVGNVEIPKNSFTVNMDQRDPSIDLVYEVLNGNPVEGWTMLFTATATDVTSGMDRVEFFLNEIWQETVTGPGPEYQWSFIYHGGLNIDVRADAYDIAGNKASDIIENPETNVYNQNTQQQKQSSPSPYFLHEPHQKLFVIHGV